MRRRNGRSEFAVVETTEKQPKGAKLIAKGPAGHGSRPMRTSAVVHISTARLLPESTDILRFLSQLHFTRAVVETHDNRGRASRRSRLRGCIRGGSLRGAGCGG